MVDAYNSKISGPLLNARVGARLFERESRVCAEAHDLLLEAQKRLRISARGRSHMLRVARTVADVEGSEEVLARHVAEAVQYRSRDGAGGAR